MILSCSLPTDECWQGDRKSLNGSKEVGYELGHGTDIASAAFSAVCFDITTGKRREEQGRCLD
jgi:hypothetical protein